MIQTFGSTIIRVNTIQINKFIIRQNLHALFPIFSDDEESIDFNGRDLEGSATYKFTLEDSQGPLWSLEEQKGKVVILVFMSMKINCLRTRLRKLDS